MYVPEKVEGAEYFVPNPDELHFHACMEEVPAAVPEPPTIKLSSLLLKIGDMASGGAVEPVDNAVAGLAYLLPNPDGDQAYT